MFIVFYSQHLIFESYSLAKRLYESTKLCTILTDIIMSYCVVKQRKIIVNCHEALNMISYLFCDMFHTLFEVEISTIDTPSEW